MNNIVCKVAALGGTISTTDISHLSEYKRLLRAKERGDLIKLRHGIYAVPDALLNTMIDVERIVPNVAEKFHTMIDRDVLNSRMKDFFDCYQLLTKRDLSDDTLYDAIKATFDNRGLTYNPELQLFTESFATDAARIVRWKAFLKKIQWKETLDFKTVMEVIKERLQPMAEKYWKK